MGIINKIIVTCSGVPVSYDIGLSATNDAGINAILSAIPAPYGTYTHSHTISGGNVTATLTATEGSCNATYFQDGVGISVSNASACVIDPADLISADVGNSTTVGGDGLLYTSFVGLATPRVDTFTSFTGSVLTLSYAALTDYHTILFSGALFSVPSNWSFTAADEITLVVPVVAADINIYYYS